MYSMLFMCMAQCEAKKKEEDHPRGRLIPRQTGLIAEDDGRPPTRWTDNTTDWSDSWRWWETTHEVDW